MSISKKYLPIGSVCTLKGKTKKLMVIGYYSVEFNGNLKIKDYVGCVYPEGLLLPEQNCNFNHSDIEKVDFVGFENEEELRFKNLLNKLTGNDKSEEEKASEFHRQNDMYLTSNSTYSKLLFDENGVVMIAETVDSHKKDSNSGNFKNIKFDENGYVIGVETKKTVNPFYKNYEISNESKPSSASNDWQIFKKYEFDENGTVIGTEEIEKQDKKNKLNEIKFDENGVVISVGVQPEHEFDKNEKRSNYSFNEDGTVVSEQIYEFDANGNIVAADNKKMEEEIPPIGPGLPGYVKPENEKRSNYSFNEDGTVVSEQVYEFDVNGNIVAADNKKMEEEIPPIGPGLPGYVKPENEKRSNYSFNEDGTVVSEQIYEFDVNGNIVATDNKKMEEEIPPIGPGLPGYVKPENEKRSNYSFNEDGTVVSEQIYEFDVNGNIVATDNKEMEEEIPPIGPGLPGYVEPNIEEEVPPIGPGLPGYVSPIEELENAAIKDNYKLDEDI